MIAATPRESHAGIAGDGGVRADGGGRGAGLGRLAGAVGMAGLVIAGCGKDAGPRAKLDEGACSLATDCGSGSARSGSGSGHGLGADRGGEVGSGEHVWPATAPVLPGVIYFRSARGMERIAKGTRELVGADLYPSSQRVGGELVAIRSKGDGSADAEQLVIGSRALGFAAAQVRDPAADPKGAWVVVAAMRDGHSDLYRIDIASGTDIRLTSNLEGNFAPAILDAKNIVFTSSRDGDSEIYRLSVGPQAGASSATRLTAFHRDDWGPAPSPDGERIAFVSDREGTPRIFVMSARGTDLHRLTTRTDESEESSPVWSPDGKRIVYVVQRVGGAAGGRRESEVVLHDVAAKTERSLTTAAIVDGMPTFSPDGDHVLVSRQPPDGAATMDDLWVFPLAGGAAIQLTNDVGSETIPRWLPD